MLIELFLYFREIWEWNFVCAKKIAGGGLNDIRQAKIYQCSKYIRIYRLLSYYCCQRYDWYQSMVPFSRYPLIQVTGTHFLAGRDTGLTIGDTTQTCQSCKLRARHGTRSIFNLQFCHNGIACVSWKSDTLLRRYTVGVVRRGIKPWKPRGQRALR